jgi:hypothetical protein
MRGSAWQWPTATEGGGTRLVARFSKAWDGTLLDPGARPAACGVTQAFTSGGDVAYGACQAALKAATYEIRSLVQRFTPAENARFVAAVTVPVVVFQGRIFGASLNQDELHVVEVTSGLTVWRVPDDLQSYAVDVIARQPWKNSTVAHMRPR